MNRLLAKFQAMYQFPRQVRLLTASQFRNVFKGTLVSQDRYFRIKALLTRDPHPRLGLAISRRVSKRAVDRNRIKRAVRESFRHHQAELAGLDIVVVGHQAAAQASGRELSGVLERHWQQLIEKSKKDGAQARPAKDK